MYHARHPQFPDRVACDEQPTPNQILILTDDLTQVTCFGCDRIVRWVPGYVGHERRLVKA